MEAPSIESIPQMINQDDAEAMVPCTSMNSLLDDENIEQEKVFVNQESQVNREDLKSMKRIKTPKRPRPIKSAASQFSTKTIERTSKTDLAPSKTDDRPVTRNCVTVDTSKARSNLDVVRMCIRELRWKECPFPSASDSDIYWHSQTFHEGNANFASSSGRVNKFPGMSDLLRKVHLTRSLNNMRLLFPDEYDFYPKTWFLPEQSQQFKDDIRYIHKQDKMHHRSLTTFIVKPSDGSQGEGIYLFRDPAHCTVTSRPHVVQEYIDRPLLMNGLKFDLRIYALILNLYPLEIFLYDEGLVRFATVHYDAPSTDNLHQTYMHLTNYSLNKRSSNYKHVVDSQQTDGSKRKLSTVWTQLICSYGNVRIEEVKLSITEMVNKTILAILPNLRVEYELEIPLTRKQSLSCFQIVGFDIILTNELKPVLLEVNANPSLRIDFDKENEMGKIIYHASPIDEEIKRPLILETLKLALPKKRLQTFTRHAQIQVKDELLIQRLERVAQRRIDERNERFKSARNTRFDIKRNPYFSRPLPTRKSKECEDTISIESPHELLLSADKQIIHARVTSKGQRGRSATVARHSMMKSAASRPRSPPRFNSPKRLQLIYPSSDKTKYQHLVLIDKIAYIYIHFVVIHGDKTMSNAQFRTFANTCGIIDEIITASSIDILYYQIVRKWQQFVSRVPVSGLPFSAFVEVMFLLSQRKYTNASSLLDSVYELVNICIRNLKSYFQTPASQQQQQRSIRNNRTVPKQTTKSIFPLFFDVL
ncbi:unnamed protein product [Adineta ricciae]|uniref:Uncharacterized protein n=1 Tax=Adineta ricciae TaxID=249248 RepID=A0A815LEV6_ADIRI|nr:unnamed protein product [Adineta ricciae]